MLLVTFFFSLSAKFAFETKIHCKINQYITNYSYLCHCKFVTNFRTAKVRIYFDIDVIKNDFFMKKYKIKENMLLYCKLHSITETELSRICDVSYTVFSPSSIEQSLSSDSLASFLDQHRDINPYWLLFGEGDMLCHDFDDVIKTESKKSISQNNDETPKDEVWKELVNSKNQIIAIQAEQLAELRVRLAKIEGVGQ